MQKYHEHFPVTQTPQTQPIPGSSQMPNNAGGYAWGLDHWSQLDRFLVLGAEGGTYYVEEKELTVQNAHAVLQCIQEDGQRVVKRVVDISASGRAHKNDPALFVLAMCASLGSPETRKTALYCLAAVARIGTHLFHFLAYAQSMRGWGRGLRNAIKAWYVTKSPMQLAYDVTKYQSRDGWSHRDALRLAHPKPATVDQQMIYKYVSKGEEDATLPASEELVRYIHAVEEAKRATNAEQIAALIRAHNLPRECVPTQFLTDPATWEALLERMPLHALIRNLGNMSKSGLLVPMNPAVTTVCNKLADRDQLHKSRVHPMAVLIALKQYASGHGFRGSSSWTPVPQVIDALDAAFYDSFHNVVPTGKRILIGVDGSGSMQQGMIAGTNLSCAQAAAAMAMVTVATEPSYAICAFTTRLVEINLSPRMRLNDAVARLFIAAEGTDGAIPIEWARQSKMPVDAFLLITDNETWAGHIHPAQSLKMYRREQGIQAKLIAMGMVANNVSVADPNDAGSLNVVGFDANVPGVCSDFIRG